MLFSRTSAFPVHSMEGRRGQMILSVWGSERRMEEVRRLARHSHTCVTREDLQTLDLSMLDALILPLHGVQGRRGEYMDREHIALPDGFWACLREDCLIISGMPSPFLESLPQTKRSEERRVGN